MSACTLFNGQDKGSNPLSIITWSVLGKQNVQAKKVYCQAEAPCTFKNSSSNLPFADISLHALRCTCLGPDISMWLKKDSHSAKACTPSNFLFQQKISRNPSCVASNILPISMLYFQTVSTIMHDVSTHSTPQNIHSRELFHSSDVHVYNTRFSCADNLFVQRSRLHMKLKSFPADRKSVV